MNTREEIAEQAITNFVNNSEPSTDLILLGNYLIHVDNCGQCDFNTAVMFSAEISVAIINSHTEEN